MKQLRILSLLVVAFFLGTMAVAETNNNSNSSNDANANASVIALDAASSTIELSAGVSAMGGGGGGGQTGTVQYQITLVWTEPTPPAGVTVAGYNVFHSGVACSANGTFSQINPSQTPGNPPSITGLTYVVPTLMAPNANDCFYVEAVSAIGISSNPSGSLSLSTIAPPAPGTPTGTVTPTT